MLGLVDIVVARHGRYHGPESGKRRRLANDSKEDFASRAEEDAHTPGDLPDALCALVVTGGLPDGARKVPEVDGRVICDKEDFAVDALVAQGNGKRGGGSEQQAGGKKVSVGNVANVGKVEDVGVVAELDV